MAPERGRTRPDAKGDSAPGAARPVLFRGRRRVSRSPRRRTSSTSAKTGKPAAAAEKRRPCTRAADRSSPSRQSSRRRPEGPFDFRHQAREAQLTRAGPGDEDDIPARQRREGVAVEDCPQSPADPVANDRAADLGAHGHADSRALTAVGYDTRKEFRRPPPSRASDPSEIGTPAERVVSSHARSSGAAASNGEPLAPFFAPGRDHAAPVFRRHPRQEAMDALTSPVVGLKGALHSTGTPDIKMAVFGGSTVVYGSQRRAVNPTAKPGGPASRRCESFLRCPHVWTTLWKSAARIGPKTPN
jgi:hypothetical protein